jgi:hypothetical protein
MDEKPKKEKKIRYPGMRKFSERVDGRSKKRPKKKKEKIEILSYKDGHYRRTFSFANGRINPEQKEDYENFMKVREGETHEQWIERTKFKRMTRVKDLQTRKVKKKTIHSLASARRRNDYQRSLEKSIKIQIAKKDFGFLRNLVNVLYWASAKYDVENHYLQIGLLFYNDGYPFSKDQFKQRLCMMTGNTDKAFHQFKIRGYIKEVIDKKLHFEKAVLKGTGLFMLSDKFNYIIKQVYDKLVLLGGFDNFGNPYILTTDELDSPRENAIFEELKKMHSEYMEILQGQKEHQGFPPRKKPNPKRK